MCVSLSYRLIIGWHTPAEIMDLPSFNRGSSNLIQKPFRGQARFTTGLPGLVKRPLADSQWRIQRGESPFPANLIEPVVPWDGVFQYEYTKLSFLQDQAFSLHSQMTAILYILNLQHFASGKFCMQPQFTAFRVYRLRFICKSDNSKIIQTTLLQAHIVRITRIAWFRGSPMYNGQEGACKHLVIQMKRLEKLHLKYEYHVGMSRKPRMRASKPTDTLFFKYREAWSEYGHLSCAGPECFALS